MPYMYSQALTHCIEQSEKHGDYNLHGALVNVFDGRYFRLFVSTWICEHLGLKSKIDRRGPFFAKGGKPPNKHMSFKVSAEEFAGANFKAKVLLKLVDRMEEKAQKNPDMLDSRSRPPGSFGHGSGEPAGLRTT